jgi:Intrinsic membrane protein PufX
MIMSDDYFTTTRAQQLNVWVAGLMLKGAGWAAAILIGIGLVIWAIYGIGLLLPEASRETPSPYGALDVPAVTEVA